jgi:hypothetical protein
LSEVEVILLNGERRRVMLARPSDSIAQALDRLDDWIETVDGGWVQKTYIVEVRPINSRVPGDDVNAASAEPETPFLVDEPCS